MAPPMVLVSCDRFVRNGLVWSGGPESYLNALAVVGLLPVQFPTISEVIDPAPLLDVCAGVLITGARANVHPSLYGAQESEAAKPFDPDRDRTTLPLIRQAVARGIPLFCICRGIQEMNVAFGGSLHHSVHALPGRDDHRSPQQEDVDAWFGLRHDIEIRDGGLLRPILGERVRVNSVHHQGIDRLAERARVEAVAPDGTIEAISIAGASAFALGVQWHPEHFVKDDGPSRGVFEAFAKAVADHAAHRLAHAA